MPSKYSSAKIIVSDKVGTVLKEMNLSDRGKGSLTLNAAILEAINYTYMNLPQVYEIKTLRHSSSGETEAK